MSSVSQNLKFVGTESGKLLALRTLFKQGIKPPILVFVQSIERAKELYTEIKYEKLKVDVIHCEKSTEDRNRIVKNFRLGDIWVLISTNLMARGMDFKGVNLVVNYDFPQTKEEYIHRIGRAGRVGRHGTAITLYT